MFGSVVKYTLVVIAGAALFACGMHYADDVKLEEIRAELEAVRMRARAAGEDADVAVHEFAKENYKVWQASIVLSMNLTELDNIIAKAKAA